MCGEVPAGVVGDTVVPVTHGTLGLTVAPRCVGALEEEHPEAALAEQREPVVQSTDNLARTKDTGAGSRQLKSEWDPVQGSKPSRASISCLTRSYRLTLSIPRGS